VIASFWVQKPIRTARFLTLVGVEFLPFVKLGTAFLIIPVMMIYSWMADRFPRQRLVYGFVLLFSLTSIGFRMLFLGSSADWVHYVYFFYVDIFNTVMVALFWSFANDLTPPDQARRIYGFVGAGGITGGIVGSAVTGWGVGHLGAENLLLFCVVLLLGILGIAWGLTRHASPQTQSPQKSKNSWKAAISGAKLTFKNSYLLYIVGIVMLYEISSNLIDYQFSYAASAAFPETTQLSAFLGKLSSGVNVASLFFQVFLTTWILRRFGPRVGLLVLPLVLGLGSLTYLAIPIFAVAVGLFSSDGGLHYSVNQTSKEVLYTPTTSEEKYQAKAFIDMFGMRFAKGIGALLILGCTAFLGPLGWKVHYFSFLALAFIGVWGFFAWRAGNRFDELTTGNSP